MKMFSKYFDSFLANYTHEDFFKLLNCYFSVIEIHKSFCLPLLSLETVGNRRFPSNCSTSNKKKKSLPEMYTIYSQEILLSIFIIQFFRSLNSKILNQFMIRLWHNVSTPTSFFVCDGLPMNSNKISTPPLQWRVDTYSTTAAIQQIAVHFLDQCIPIIHKINLTLIPLVVSGERWLVGYRESHHFMNTSMLLYYIIFIWIFSKGRSIILTHNHQTHHTYIVRTPFVLHFLNRSMTRSHIVLQIFFKYLRIILFVRNIAWTRNRFNNSSNPTRVRLLPAECTYLPCYCETQSRIIIINYCLNCSR